MTHGPSTFRRRRRLSRKERLRRERRESRARREAEWFYDVLGGRVPSEDIASPEVRTAAAQVEAWLKAVPAFHRGALSLRYTPRDWPAAIVGEFEELAGVAVRLECALHPAIGKTNAELEQASIERIEKAVEARRVELEELDRAAGALTAEGFEPAPVPVGPRREDPPRPAEVELERLDSRAERHVVLAIRALGKVRGDAPCVVPRKPRGNAKATPVTEPPSSAVRVVPSATEPPVVFGVEAEDQDAPSPQEVRTCH